MNFDKIISIIKKLPHLKVLVAAFFGLVASLFGSYFLTATKITKKSDDKLYKSPTLSLKLVLLLLVVSYTAAFQLRHIGFNAGGFVGALSILYAHLPGLILWAGWSIKAQNYDFKASILPLIYIASMLALIGGILCGVELNWK